MVLPLVLPGESLSTLFGFAAGMICFLSFQVQSVPFSFCFGVLPGLSWPNLHMLRCILFRFRFLFVPVFVFDSVFVLVFIFDFPLTAIALGFS